MPTSEGGGTVRYWGTKLSQTLARAAICSSIPSFKTWPHGRVTVSVWLAAVNDLLVRCDGCFSQGRASRIRSGRAASFVVLSSL